MSSDNRYRANPEFDESGTRRDCAEDGVGMVATGACIALCVAGVLAGAIYAIFC